MLTVWGRVACHISMSSRLAAAAFAAALVAALAAAIAFAGHRDSCTAGEQ